jgi:hypothetical protein
MVRRAMLDGRNRTAVPLSRGAGAGPHLHDNARPKAGGSPGRTPVFGCSMPMVELQTANEPWCSRLFPQGVQEKTVPTVVGRSIRQKTINVVP